MIQVVQKNRRMHTNSIKMHLNKHKIRANIKSIYSRSKTHKIVRQIQRNTHGINTLNKKVS